MKGGNHFTNLEKWLGDLVFSWIFFGFKVAVLLVMLYLRARYFLCTKLHVCLNLITFNVERGV